MVKLIIDDKTVAVEEGTTILKAAQTVGIKIPNMCYDKRLRPYGGCRLCVVEVEGMPRLLASCSTPVASGMVVKTDTPKLRKARQTVLELMLVHHPLDCPVCDKAGECDLQDIAYEYGKPEGRFIRHRKDKPPDIRGPLIEMTANRCILCGKCVRICNEYQGRGALGLIGRGFPTVVQAAFGEILECDYCGQCIDVCPTGALLPKPFKYQARAWFLEEKDTICPFCGCGCTLTLGLREGKILRSRGKEDTGRSDGNLCGRGRFGFDYLYSENRLKSPMIRKDGELVPVTWEEALSFVGDGLRKVIDAGGPASAGAIGSHRCTNEDNFMLRKFMTDVVGSVNIDSSSAFTYEGVKKAVSESFGFTDHRIELDSPFGKDVIFVVESDISITHPVLGLNIMKAKREGARLIVADTKETKLTRHCSDHLRMRPGTSVALLNGIMKVIIDKGLFDREAASKIDGFGKLEKSLASYTADKAAELTGIPSDAISDAAAAIAAGPKRMVCLSLGAYENTKGLDVAYAASNLILLLGEGAEALQIPAEYANTTGAFRMLRRPDLGPSKGKMLGDMIYGKGGIKALYIMGEDPVSKFPDAAQVIERLKSLDFMVVQDIAMTETAKLAHAVFPAAGWAEKAGTFINAEGIEQTLQRVVDPPGQALPDWQILRNLSLAMGREIRVRGLDDLTGEIRSSVKQTADRKDARAFHAVEPAPAKKPEAGFDFSLIARDMLQHSGSMSTRSKSLDLVVSEPFVEINSEDAGKLGIGDNSHVRIASKLGTVYLKAKVTDAVMPGTVCSSTHFPYGRVNALVSATDNGAPAMDAVSIAPVKP